MENESERVFKDERFGKSRFLMYSYDKGFVRNAEFRNRYGQAMAQQAWDLFAERTADARKMVLEGKASPILYYMEKALLNPGDLSKHMGISVFRVKRHLKPGVFEKLSGQMLEKYAEVFNITKDQLRKI